MTASAVGSTETASPTEATVTTSALLVLIKI